MDIKEKLAKIREVVGDEKAGEISPFLSEIQAEFISLDSDNKANIRESMGRKDKIRTQEGEIYDLKADVEKLSDETTVNDLKKENDTLKSFQKKVYGDTRKSFEAKIESYKEDEKFGAVIGNLGIATKTEQVDGKPVVTLDLASMDDNAVNVSLTKIIEYEGIGVLGSNGENETVDSPGPDGIIKKTVKKTDGEVDIVALSKSDPAAAAAILEKEGLGDRSFSVFKKQ